MPKEFYSRHVFLSYSRKDTAIMQRLRDDLRAGGLTVWTDESLEPGTPSWKTAIEDAIEQAGALVIVMSPDSKESIWVERELDYARAQEVRIFPALARGDAKTAVPLELVNAQRVDIRSSADYDVEVRKLIAAIAAHLSMPLPAAPALEPEAHTITYMGSDFIYITAGSFMMGSTPRRVTELVEIDGDAFRLEEPRHEVALPGFYIARYPVTNGEYKSFIDASDHRVPFRDDDWSRPYSWDPDTRTFPAGRENYPVVLVSWRDALAYCEWAGGRLPTEAEWEKAARGADGREWPWGSAWQDGRCNTEESGLQETTPINRFSPAGDSPYGVGDMAGNTWDWCSSLPDPYPYDPTDGREDPAALGPRVLRGGAMGLKRWVARCAFRNSTHPDDYGFSIGFRMVLDSRPDDAQDAG